MMAKPILIGYCAGVNNYFGDDIFQNYTPDGSMDSGGNPVFEGKGAAWTCSPSVGAAGLLHIAYDASRFGGNYLTIQECNRPVVALL